MIHFRYLISFLAIGILVMSCTGSNVKKTADKRFKLGVDDYTILEYREDIFYPLRNSVKTTLSETELAETEVILKRIVKEYNKGWSGPGKINLRRKKRQYVSVINKNDEKEVWVNFFCYENDKWKEEVVVVYDGGSCNFNVVINLTNKNYYDLKVNGPA